MKYKVECAVGYDHGGWESFWVEVEIPDDAEKLLTKAEWNDHMLDAAEEQILIDLGPNPHEVFTVVLSYFQEEEDATE